MKKSKTNKKLASAAAMLLLSAAMLGTSTYAWFTMNKNVEVKGMQLKAQAEKGILINEMQGADASANGTWSEEALAGQDSPIALKPASTSDLATWWHANSKKTNSEAGAGTSGVDSDTLEITDGVYYTDIKPGATGITPQTTAATKDTNAERNVYYSDGTGPNSGYDDGEGYYVLYKYYIKSSSNEALNVASGSLQATITATKLNATGATDSTDLDKALRVGIKVGSNIKIFAPLAEGTSVDYKVAGSTAGTTYSDVSAVKGDTATAINTAAVSLPAVTADGLEVDVYVWYEGEDVNCKSDNLTAVLDSYKIDIKFTDADIN